MDVHLMLLFKCYLFQHVQRTCIVVTFILNYQMKCSFRVRVTKLFECTKSFKAILEKRSWNIFLLTIFLVFI